MAKWTDMGHAMRRRVGAPSNHFEAAGATAGQTHPTLDDHYNHAQSSTSARVALGDGPIDTPHETMSPEQNAPSFMGDASKDDRNGASYKVTASIPVLADPTVGPTYAKGRIVQSTMGGTTANFYSAVEDSNL